MKREDLADLKSMGLNTYAFAIAQADEGTLSNEQMAAVLRDFQKAHVEVYEALDVALSALEDIEETADRLRRSLYVEAA